MLRLKKQIKLEATKRGKGTVHALLLNRPIASTSNERVEWMTKIYGHRGSKGQFPENTLLSFQQAINEGVDGIELDVHLTKDKEVVVIHDERLDRTTNGSGFINKLTLEEIKQYSAGVKYADYDRYEESWNLEKVPTLQEVLELLAPYDLELNIELKTNLIQYEGLEEKVLSILKDFPERKKVILSSFHLQTLLNIRRLDSHAQIAYLLNQPIPLPKQYAEILGFEALHLNKSVVLSNPGVWQSLGSLLRIWTVNEEEEIQQLLDMNVAAIITDYPDKALALRKHGDSSSAS